MYATNGTSFSINPEVDPAINLDEGRGSSQKKSFGAIKPKNTPKKETSKQVAEFYRMESKGITSMSNISSKPPGDRDETEKQFFVMFLKLRVPFFADFDKKTLRPVMERMLCSFYKKH